VPLKFPFLPLPTAEILKWKVFYEVSDGPDGLPPYGGLVQMEAGSPVSWYDSVHDRWVLVPETWQPGITQHALERQISIEMATDHIMRKFARENVDGFPTPRPSASPSATPSASSAAIPPFTAQTVAARLAQDKTLLDRCKPGLEAYEKVFGDEKA